MKKAIHSISVLIPILLMVSCDVFKEEPPQAPPRPVVFPQIPLDDSQTPAHPPISPPPSVPDSLSPLHQSLIGTKWKIGDISAHFKTANQVTLQGGPFAELAMQGVETAYTFEDGNITIRVLGETQTGTWDGTTLSINNTTAVLQTPSQE